MKIDRTREKGITMVTLVVTIILLLILAGVSINMALGENGLIIIARKAKENMELSQIEEQTKLNELYRQMETGEGGGNIEYGDTGKINEFKKKIAEYIEQAGGVKPEPPETASTETFGESILGIVSEVTKDATAKPENITSGKTAYVNGEKITGTMVSLESQTIGTATAEDILSGKTAWVNGNKVTGTMTNQGAKTATINAGESYTIPEGYHNGQGKVTANSLESQTGGTATADKILKDYTAYVNGKYIVGTMSNNGAVNKTLKAGESYTILPGYHNGSGKVQAADLASQTQGTATAESIEKGKIAWVNGNKVIGTREIEEGKYYDPYIPNGFKYKEGSWNNGYTIIGEIENINDEFVWIPCVLDQKVVREGDTVVTFGKTTEGKYNSNRSLGLLPTSTNIYAEDISVYEIKESVRKYEGFYIGKYEAGIEATVDNYALKTKTPVDGTVKPLSQLGKGIWNYITEAEAQKVSKIMLNEEITGVKSTLISGEAWDTTLQWMVNASDNRNNEPNKDYDINSTNKGWYGDTQARLQKTGYYGINNIYDMAGNVAERTSEHSTGGTSVIRGGDRNDAGSTWPAASRNSTTAGRDAGLGFRVMFYK